MRRKESALTFDLKLTGHFTFLGKRDRIRIHSLRAFDDRLESLTLPISSEEIPPPPRQGR